MSCSRALLMRATMRLITGVSFGCLTQEEGLANANNQTEFVKTIAEN